MLQHVLQVFESSDLDTMTTNLVNFVTSLHTLFGFSTIMISVHSINTCLFCIVQGAHLSLCIYTWLWNLVVFCRNGIVARDSCPL